MPAAIPAALRAEVTATLRAAGARFALVHGSRVLAVLRKEAAADDRRRADACGWAG